METTYMRLTLKTLQSWTPALMQEVAGAVARFPTEGRFRMLRLGLVRELAGRGEAPEKAVEMVAEDGRELRLVSGGSATEVARAGLAVGQAYVALGQFDAAEQQLKLAREEKVFQVQAERSLALLQKVRRGAGLRQQLPHK